MLEVVSQVLGNQGGILLIQIFTPAVYIDVRDGNCANLAMQLSPTAVMGTVMTPRSWQIKVAVVIGTILNELGANLAQLKVTQYDCAFENLAPAGCTQYFFGPTSQTVQTFNFAGGQHLANQKQQICVRRERGQCMICWTTTMDTDFVVSGEKLSSP